MTDFKVELFPAKKPRILVVGEAVLNRGFWLALVFCLSSGCLSGCASSNDAAPSGSPANVRQERGPCESPELVELWRERDSNTPADFPVGPGDVILVSVPEVDEIQKQETRVSPDGTIALPLIGTMQVAGMSENELRAAISQRLAVYMKFPRVELFVERYQARDVAVVGAVQKPGMYDLANPNESIINVIGIAGGMTANAAQKVIFVPPKYDHGSLNSGQMSGSAAANETTQDGVAANDNPASDSGNQIHASPYLKVSTQAAGQTPTDTDLKGRSWIELDLAKPGAQACLDFPVRPGDVVIVPIAGQVMVQGWVQTPGAFNITPGMTILGAISAAGGATFSWTAELLRTGPDGRQTVTEVSLNHLAEGEDKDIPVQSGDVVVVERSVIGAVPYTVFELFQHFGSGFAFP
ncbi:MAG: polysaccharide biosynthesis/export family protein, partial [Candidatus Binatus sp.]